MNLIEPIWVALTQLRANKMRSALTMLGIAIGVTSVIALVSIGRGAQASITAEIQGMGSNLLFVIPGSITEGGMTSASGQAATLTLGDARAIASPLAAPSVAMVAPEASRGAQVSYGSENIGTQVVGTTPEYEEVRNFHPEQGDFISQQHVDARSRVAVVGAGVVEDLFGEGDPLGETIKVNRVGFRVIGVLESKGGGGFGSQDDTITIPITTFQSRLFGRQGSFRGEDRVGSINVAAVSEGEMDQAVEEISEILRQRHDVTYEDDFNIISQKDIVAAISQVTTILTLFLGSIAAISLVVGGIGIMNIMLVSVTERTREIGIRKAVGAKKRDILAQFLVEAVIISVAGGIIGTVLGALLAGGISRIPIADGNLPTAVGPDVVLLATLFSVVVGLFFGIYPANRAAGLDPIEALRYE
jgi:putative ABC transport system permease protein